jgi:hypothetical protein
MNDEDKPITRGDVRKTAVTGCGLILAIILCGGVGLFILYIMACANMPTGCH